jgi:hypothetical protein
MSFVLDPDEVQKFWLASDANKPIESRPIFHVRTANRRLRNRHGSLRSQAAKHEAEALKAREANDVDGVERATAAKEKLLIEMALMGVIGVEKAARKAFEATAEWLDEVLADNSDLQDLACNWPDAASITEADVKNSSSPLPSDAEKSATTAAAENALMSPAPTNLSESNPLPAPGATVPPETANDAPTVVAAAN